MILSLKEIALIKCIRGKTDQIVIIKAKDGDILGVERVSVTKSKEKEVLVTVEKKEKLYPI